MALEVKDISGLEHAFGPTPDRLRELLPAWDDIPAEFKNPNRPTKWNTVFNDWFYCGLEKADWKPKPGIDTNKAIAHVHACMTSWEPQHEHKEAGVAYLLSEFFEDVTYTKKPVR